MDYDQQTGHRVRKSRFTRLWTILLLSSIPLLVIAGILCFTRDKVPSSDAPEDLKQQTQQPLDEPPTTTVHGTIALTATGFQPASLTIQAGQTVRFTNQDSAGHQVATEPHPIHDQLPGLFSEPLDQDASYDYTFTTAGTYTFHDERHPDFKATVVVTETN